MKLVDKKNVIAFLIVLLLALALGYAAFSTTLNINGTATGTGTWDVHFKQNGTFYQADGTTVDTTHNGLAPISTTTSTNDTMTVTVDLAYPGDGVLLEAIVENSGNLPANLQNFTITNNNPDLIVEKAAGGPSSGQVLAANGGTCTAKFLIKWDPESTSSGLGSKTFTITYQYNQTGTEFTGTPSHSDAAGTNP